MENIIKKLIDSGVSSETIEKLKVGLGHTFETELVSDGLKAAAEKIGIDPADLPHVDFSDIDTIDPDIIVDETDTTETSSQPSSGGFFTRVKKFLGF